jgi:hypothetical protein
MNKRLAIKGHSTRGNEVIELLKMMGGKNCFHLNGLFSEHTYYFIGGPHNDEIRAGEYMFDEYAVLQMIDDMCFFTLEEFLDKFPFKVGDKVYIKVDPNANCLGSEKMYGEIESAVWVEKFGHVVYKLKDCSRIFYREELHPCEEEVSMEDNKVKGYCTKAPEKCNETKKIAWFKFWDNDFADKVELDLNDRELIQENGKWFVVKKKPKYPKTYKECCEIVKVGKEHTLEGEIIRINNYKIELLESFQKLLICRDAYWKIAGEEMGLDKPWKPDFTDTKEMYYIFYKGYIEKGNQRHPNNHILIFPTPEMRDAFYENFKKEIEECKELL